MTDGEYEVCIDSSLRDGHLTYGEYYIPGERADEILLSCHICHPSLCNDNLSGVALMVGLFKHLSQKTRRYSYRFLFIPGTIGSITWLALNEARVSSIKHGIVLPVSETRVDLPIRGLGAEMRRSIESLVTFSGTRLTAPTSLIFIPTDTTNASSARPASIFR